MTWIKRQGLMGIYLTSLALFMACNGETIKPTDNEIDSGTPPNDSESPPFFLHAELILNRSGRLFMTDGETGEEIWSLQNPDDPVWSDARLDLDHKSLWHNVV